VGPPQPPGSADGRFLKEHITLRYAATVDSAQGVAADSSYMAMTRGRQDNDAFLCQKFSNEADHEHAEPMAAPAIHHLRRGDKHSAAQPTVFGDSSLIACGSRVQCFGASRCSGATRCPVDGLLTEESSQRLQC
jgi:hypothetical protein